MRQTSIQKGISSADSLLPTARPDVVQVTYDPEADAAYFAVDPARAGKIARTIELQDWLLADVDKDGKLLGVEMLFVSSRLSGENVEDFHVTATA